MSKEEILKNIKSDYIFNQDEHLWKNKNMKSLSYSDGEKIEQYIYDVVCNAKDRGIFSKDFKNAIKDWPSYYYFSPVRTNLLRPFIKNMSGSVLEAGCGCGALTRFLGENVENVIALEGSKNRAKITSKRCEELQNIDVVVDDIMSFSVKNFDFVTLIGVLEYAPCFIDSENPIQDMLKHIRSLIKDDGVLVLAIENQLGLKYLAGAKEDHLNQSYVGIEGTYFKKEPQTFCKKRLITELENAGFKDTFFYYPFPDYKHPKLIIADKINSKVNIESLFSALQEPNYYQMFSERLAFKSFIKNDNWKDFSNSFLILASPTKGKLDTIVDNSFSKNYTIERGKSFAVETSIKEENGQIKVAREKLVNSYLDDDIQKLQKEEDYISGVLYTDGFYKVIYRENWSSKDIALWAKPWVDFLLKNSENIDNKHFLDAKYLDCVTDNIVIDSKGNLRIFDLEWNFKEKVLVDFVVFRGLKNCFIRLDLVSESNDALLSKQEILINTMKELGFDDIESNIKTFYEKEEIIFEKVFESKCTVSSQLNEKFLIRKIYNQEDLVRMQNDTNFKIDNYKNQISKIEKENGTYKDQLLEIIRWKEKFDMVRTGIFYKIFRFLRRVKNMCVLGKDGGILGFVKWIFCKDSKNKNYDPAEDFPEIKI